MRRDPREVTGYTYQQLARAFDRVRDPRDWRRPVRAEIPPDMEELVARAVVWFTATAPAFAATGRGQLLATAPGYLQGPWGRPDAGPEPVKSPVPSAPGVGSPVDGRHQGGEPALGAARRGSDRSPEPDDPWGFRGPAFGR